MLNGIDPVISPDLLYALHRMGHGDELVLADANFPAYGLGVPAIEAAGVSVSELLTAILPLFPLDTFEDCAFRMEIVSDPLTVPPVCQEFQEILGETAINPLERVAFYERAKTAFVIVRTSEVRHYGNLILKKGVVT